MRKQPRDYLAFRIELLERRGGVIDVIVGDHRQRIVSLPCSEILNAKRVDDGVYDIVIQRWLARDRGIENETTTIGG